MDKSNHMTIFIFIDDSRIIPSLSMFRNRTGPTYMDPVVLLTNIYDWFTFEIFSNNRLSNNSPKGHFDFGPCFHDHCCSTAVVVGLVAKIGGGNFVWNWIWPYTTNNGTYKQHVRDSFWTRLGMTRDDLGWFWVRKIFTESCLEFCQIFRFDLINITFKLEWLEA